MLENITQYKRTQEFQDTFTYMVSILGNEFPTSEFTPEYLILSILDNTKCHANMIMDNILMSESMDYLRNYYHGQLQSMDRKPILDNMPPKASNELIMIMGSAVREAKALNSPLLGSEHVLLALVNPQNSFSTAKALLDCGLRYNYMMGQAQNLTESAPTESPRRYINNNDNKIPLKSEIHSQVSVNNGETPNIKRYTINLHDEITKGHYDKLVGRDDILKNIIKVLSRRKKNNVILVGKPGVGKTSIAYKLAELIESGNVPEILSDKQVIMLDAMALVSGTHLRGMFEERVDGLFKELRNNPNYILFLDDMQNAVRSMGKDKDGDLTDVIGNILSEGEVRVIGAISLKDYRNSIEANSTLATKLQKIMVEPSTDEETMKILKTNKYYYENFHHVKFSDNVLLKTIQLAKRYITNNSLPDSALDVIDLTGASISLTNRQEKNIKEIKAKLASFDEEKKQAMNSGDFEKLDEISRRESALNKELSDARKNINNDESTWIHATEDNIADTVSTMTNIPISKLKANEKETVLNISNILKKSVIGQDEAINEIAKAIKRAKAGFGDKSKVMASLLLIGGSGCGKTLISKELAKNIFGSEDSLVRFDMSEYHDKTSVNKFIGASAGYIGYENGGLLTEAVKNKPYCVLLFDEIEKADESVYNLFLQLFDEGRLTDNNGTTVNFKNVIVIMTSNIGVKQANERGGGIGFTANADANKRSIIEKCLKSKFSPEFLNRIDKIIHFNTLTDDNIHTIVGLELEKLRQRVRENGIDLVYDDKIVEYVFKQAIEEKEYGARPIMRIIQDSISDKVVDLVLASDQHENRYNVTIGDNNEVIATVFKTE